MDYWLLATYCSTTCQYPPNTTAILRIKHREFLFPVKTQETHILLVPGAYETLEMRVECAGGGIFPRNVMGGDND